MKDQDLSVRNAVEADVDRVVELESQIFSAQSITPFDSGHFRAWLEVYPQGFFVVERQGIVVGYAYTQIINCNPNDPAELARWISYDEMNDRGYTRASHRPDGNYHLGVNVGSVVPGAGKILVESMVNLALRLNKPILGMSRISGLKAYFDKLIELGIVSSSADAILVNAVALAYVLQCASMVGGAVKLMDSCPGKDFGRLPQLPPVDVPDPVLCKYLRNRYVAVWALLPQFIQDPASLNYSVLTGPAK